MGRFHIATRGRENCVLPFYRKFKISVNALIFATRRQPSLNVNLHDDGCRAKYLLLFATVTNASSANEISHKRSGHK